jgi:hypothetical protein
MRKADYRPAPWGGWQPCCIVAQEKTQTVLPTSKHACYRAELVSTHWPKGAEVFAPLFSKSGYCLSSPFLRR